MDTIMGTHDHVALRELQRLRSTHATLVRIRPETEEEHRAVRYTGNVFLLKDTAPGGYLRLVMVWNGIPMANKFIFVPVARTILISDATHPLSEG